MAAEQIEAGMLLLDPGTAARPDRAGTGGRGMNAKPHRWRAIAQYDLTEEDALALVEGAPGYEGRGPEQYTADDRPTPDDPRASLGLHNLIRDDLIVVCIDCEMAYTRAYAAVPCPGDPTDYRPDGEPLWNGKTLEELRGVSVGESEGSNVKAQVKEVGRNDPCWCGSGKKFKKCHGA